MTYEDAYLRFYTPICTYIGRNLRSRDLAPDLTQTVFLRLWRHWGKLASLSEENLSSWIYHVAHNLCIDVIRRQHVRQFVSYEAVCAHVEHEPYEEDFSASCCERIVLAQELQQIWQSLRKRQRTILYLAYVERWTYSAIAEYMQTTEPAIKMVVLRAKPAFTHLKKRGIAQISQNGS